MASTLTPSQAEVEAIHYLQREEGGEEVGEEEKEEEDDRGEWEWEGEEAEAGGGADPVVAAGKVADREVSMKYNSTREY